MTQNGEIGTLDSDEITPVSNQALREHVTRTGFDLRLGKSHIMALVVISEVWAKDGDTHRAGDRPGKPSTWLTGVRGLHDRGLIWHHRPANPLRDPSSSVYGLTEAGEAVKTLLLESGIWQEYIETLPRLRVAS